MWSGGFGDFGTDGLMQRPNGGYPSGTANNASNGNDGIVKIADLVPGICSGVST